MTPLILLLAFLQRPDGGVPLRAGCSADDEQIAVVSASDAVQVRGAIAGGDGACYHVDVALGGKTVSGYILGETLPAIAEFIKQLDESSGRELEAMARQAEIERKASASAKPAAPAGPEWFDNFAGRDMRGRRVSLAALPGRVIVVQFCSARGSSKGELSSLLALYNQYHGRVSIIGVAMGVGATHLGEAFDDMILPFPVVADPGLARRYGVDPRVGKTFVLDQSHRVLASGSAADAMRAVREYLQ